MQLLQDCIVVTRGDIIENRHLVHVAVVDADNTLLYSLGDPERVTLMRSAAKPAQALAILKTGCFEKYNLSDADLALMCSSHSSEDRHLSRARAILQAVSATESDFRCGGHASLSEEINLGWLRSGLLPSGIHNNCSGKHAGMIAGSRALGVDIEGYDQPEHPMQMRVKKAVSHLSGVEASEIAWGIDGCILPAPAMRLRYGAQMYARLSAATAPGSPFSQDEQVLDIARIFSAMTTYPEMVAGENRFDTDLMRVFKAEVVGKVGAEGYFAIGIRPGEWTRKLGSEGAIGITIKIEDGNMEMAYAAAVEVLQQLKIGSMAMLEGLNRFHFPHRRNSIGIIDGEVSFRFVLRKAVT